MRNFQDTFETGERSFISAFPICMTVPLNSRCLIFLYNFCIFTKPLKTYLCKIIAASTFFHGKELTQAAQKPKFCVKGFFNEWEHILRKLEKETLSRKNEGGYCS